MSLPAWSCEACGHPRWVGYRAGPAHLGWPLKAQCVRCGRVHPLPEAEEPMPEPTEIKPFVTARLIDELPDPRQLAQVVKARIEEATAYYREQRGEVANQTDTYDMQRRLQATAEQCADYERGFRAAGKQIRQIQEEELIEAVGEQHGIPLSGLTVPTAGGDIVVTPQFANEHTIALDDIKLVLEQRIRNLYMAKMGNNMPEPFRANALIEAVRDTVDMLIATGKYEPQITKVKAAAAELARAGEDELSGAMLATIKTRRAYQDKVKVERKTPK